MLKFLKNNAFFLLLVVLVAGSLTIALYTGQRKVPQPDIVPVARPDADKDEEGLLGRSPTHHIDNLFDTGAQHVSPYYSDGGNWRLSARAFVAVDLDDMIAWHAEKHPNADPGLYTRNEVLDEFEKYTDHMKSESWLLWLTDRERHRELFETWQQHWRDLTVENRNRFHKRALEAKRQHLQQNFDGKAITHEQLARRCEHVFVLEKGRVVPRNGRELPQTGDSRSRPTHAREQSSFDDFKDWAKDNIFWTFLICCIIAGSILWIFFRLLPMLRD